MKKVMLLAAMLAMVLAAAVPALAQNTSNVACVQTAINQAPLAQGAASQYGVATNINIQAISQQCNVTVAQVNAVVGNMPSATANAPSAAQYQYTAPAAAQYQYSSASASASASPSASPSASASPSSASAPALPPTGGSSLIALGAGVLLVAGGLLARRIVR